MLKNSYHVLGVMSGTSLDGIDLAQVLLENNKGNWSYKFINVDTVAYSDLWRERLSKAVNENEASLKKLDLDYTQLLAEGINSFIDKHSIQNLDAVCSHGHTVLHRPENRITLQIGNKSALAKAINQKVICDFRIADVALGGQGAPLVPIGDKLLFGSYDYCLNLGGFANVSYTVGQDRIAYDLCPANIVLNPHANALGLAYDDGGAMARNGKLLAKKLEELNRLSYYKELPPKSLGLEWVIEKYEPILSVKNANPQDGLRTNVEHIAMQIAKPLKAGSSVLITGGGAYNLFLLERIKFYKDLNLVIPETNLVEYKEALIFGLLGVLKLRGEPNCLASVTGAKYDHSSGNIFEVE